jgi:hypothetical protein
MDVFSTELGILLSFVKTSEFRGSGGGGLKAPPHPRYGTGFVSITCNVTALRKAVTLQVCTHLKTVRSVSPEVSGNVFTSARM